jgi:hypothetical protein
MWTIVHAGLVQGQGEEGTLTIGEVLADIPHDPAAFVVYALIAGSVWLIWKANRKQPPRS